MPFLEKVFASLAMKGIQKLLEGAWTNTAEPLEIAARRTQDDFPEIEGLAPRLMEWTQTPTVRDLFMRRQGGDVPEAREILVSELSRIVHLGPQPEQRHEEILSCFLAHVERELLRSPQGLEFAHHAQMRAIERVDASVSVSVSITNEKFDTLTEQVASLCKTMGGGEAYVEEAHRLRARGRRESAKRLLETTLDTSPDVEVKSDTLAQLARLAEDEENGEQAAQLFERAAACTRDPQKKSRRGLMAIVCRGRLEEAEAGAKAHLAKYPQDEPCALLLADCLMRQDRSTGAELTLRDCGDSDDKSALTAAIHMQNGDVESATAVLLRIPPERRSTGHRLLLGHARLAQLVAARPSPLHPVSEAARAIAGEIIRDMEAMQQDIGNENPPLLARAVVIRGSARGVVGDHGGAVADLEAADRLAPLDSVSRRNYGLALLSLGRRREALAAVTTALDLGADHREVLPLALHLRAELGDPVAAVEEARTWWSQEGLLEAGLILVELLIQQGDLVEAETALQILRERFPESPDVLVGLADLAEKQGVGAPVESFLREASRYEARSGATRHATLRFARWLVRAKRFAEAAEQYLLIATAESSDAIVEEVLTCLYNAHRWRDVSEWAVRLKGRASIARFASRVSVMTRLQCDQLSEAHAACVGACAEYPDDLELLMLLLKIAGRRGVEVEIREAITALEAREERTTEALFACAEGHLVLRAYQACLESALKALRANRESSTSALRYFHLFTAVPPECGFLKHDEVAERSRVTVRIGEERRAYEIVARGERLAGVEQCSADDPLGKSLLGKRVAEQVMVATEPTRYGIVEEIMTAYVWEFQQLPRAFDERFRDPAKLRRVPFEKDLAQITQITREAHERQTELIRAYQEEPVTVGMLARCTGRTVIETWRGILWEPSVKAMCATGSLAEQSAGRERLRAGRKIVLDNTAAETLRILGKGDLLRRMGMDVLVAQSTLDDVRQWLFEERGHSHSDGGLVWIEGDKLAYASISKEQKEAQVRDIEQLLEELERATVQGRSIESNSGSVDQWEKILGKPAFTSVDLAKREGAVLVSDDLRLRELANAQFGVDGAWTIDVILAAGESGHLTGEDVAECRLRLVEMGARFVPLDAGSLTKAIRKDGMEIGQSTQCVLEAIEDAETILGSAIGVLAHALREIWFATITEERRMAILGRVLETAYRKGGSSALHQFRLGINRCFALAPLHGEELTRCIDAWARVSLRE
jgi:tetratricopeptide (TPR) repeat protein